MCLHRVTQKLEENHRVKTGWRVMEESGFAKGHYHSAIWDRGVSYKEGVWNNAIENKPIISDQHDAKFIFVNYDAGFHFFERKKDADLWLTGFTQQNRVVVKKCKGRDIRAYGEQKITQNKPAKCFVAMELYILP